MHVYTNSFRIQDSEFMPSDFGFNRGHGLEQFEAAAGSATRISDGNVV